MWGSLWTVALTDWSVVAVMVRAVTSSGQGANLDEAKTDEDTIWPDGFDPKAAGVIFD